MKSKNRFLIDSLPPPPLASLAPIDERLPREGSEKIDNQNVSQEAVNAIGDVKNEERKIFLVATSSLKKAFSDARDLTEKLNFEASMCGVDSPLICPVRIRYSSWTKAKYAEKIATTLSNQSGINARVNIGKDSVSAYVIVYPQMAFLLWSEIEEIDRWVRASPEGGIGHFKRHYRTLCKACHRFFLNLKRCRYQIFPEGEFSEEECHPVVECVIDLCNAKIALLEAIDRDFSDRKPRVFPRIEQIHEVEISNDGFFLDGAPRKFRKNVKQALRVIAKLLGEGVNLSQFSRNKFMAYYRAVDDVDQHREEGTGSFDSIRRALEEAFPNMCIISIGNGEYGIQGLSVVTKLSVHEINDLLRFYAR